MGEETALATVVLVNRDGCVEVSRLVGGDRVDLSSVDRLARLALAARRAACRVRLEDVSPVLVVLLDLAGLAWLLGTEPAAASGRDDSGPPAASYRGGGGATSPDGGGTTMPVPTPTIRVQTIHTVGVPVTDQGRALRFYVDTLGLESRLDVPLGGGRRWIEVAPPRGTATLALVVSSAATPAGVETGIRLTSTDVAADHAALAARGVDVDDVLHWEGVPPMFAFRDPDGNGLELVEEAGPWPG